MPEETDATLPDTSSGNADPVPRQSDVGIDTRYQLGAMIGRGGMGEVRLANDLRINKREVAVKLMRSANANAEHVQRFFREAYVQGTLDHPAIPPVHDVGRDRDGQPYFVMKKLAGITLGEVLEARSSSGGGGSAGAGGSDMQMKWPRRTLLSRLVDVCLAVELAHTRGVVHRDLKPANIMLGDFGETYVLDWGLAKVADVTQDLQALSGEIEAGHTAVGALLGTPGFMAPEQARGEAIDARADVYALGCILYEILTGVQALPRGLPAIDVTLSTLEHRPSKRVDVPPELDELCARATAQDRAKRPTARELANGIQAYLDGDRDLEARRSLAAELVERAQKVTPTDDATRAEATRLASRALALDPTNTTAQALVARLVLEPPNKTPAEALHEADYARGVSRQATLKMAAVTYGLLAAGLGWLFVFPVKHAWPIWSTMGLLAITTALYAYMARKPLGMRHPLFTTVMMLNVVTMWTAAYIFGPLLILPMFIVGALAGFIIAPAGYTAFFILGCHVAAFVVPVIAELAGIGPSTFVVQGSALVFTPYAVDLTPAAATFFLVGSVLVQFANTTVIGLSSRRGQDEALDRVHSQSWHLKQLLPAVKKSE